MSYRQAQFWITNSTPARTFGPFEGYTDGSFGCNNWRKPVFTLDVAHVIASAWSYADKEVSANYDPDLDAFVFHGDEDDCVAFEGIVAHLPDDTLQRMYPIGAHEWQWEEYVD